MVKEERTGAEGGITGCSLAETSEKTHSPARDLGRGGCGGLNVFDPQEISPLGK